MTVGERATAPPRVVAGDDATPSRWRTLAARFEARCPRARAMLLLAVLVLGLNGTQVHKVSAVSVIDEQYWMDHLARGAKFEIDQYGDRILPETAKERCTRSFPTEVRVPCPPDPINPKRFYPLGQNLVTHTPFYFLLTGPVARLLRATPIDLPPDDSLVTWGRLLSSAWLLLGLYFTIRAGELLGVRRRSLLVICLLLAATPALLHASTIVNPDATAFVAGAAVLLAALAWERRGKGIWMVLLAALAAALLDPTNAAGLLAVLGYLAVRGVASATGRDDEHLRPWRDYARLGGLFVAVVVIGSLAWDQAFSLIHEHVLADPPPVPSGKDPIRARYIVSSISATQILGSGTIFSMFLPFKDIALPVQRDSDVYLVFAHLAEFVAIGALIAVVLRDRLARRISALGASALGTLLVAPTLFVLYFWFTRGTYDQIVPRWGLSVLPAIGIVLAAAMRTKLAQGLFAALAAALYVSAIVVVLVDAGA